MTERLASDASPSGRAQSIQSLANSVKEAMTGTMKDAVNTAHSKAVAHEARSASHSAVKAIQSTLHSLRDGSKQSNGVKKVPAILSSNSHFEDSLVAVDSATQSVERLHSRETNLLLDRSAALTKTCGSFSSDILLLNTVWHKVMSAGGERSRRSSQIRDD